MNQAFVFCSRSMPASWRIRPSTVANDFGWIVGRPRRSRQPANAPRTSYRSMTAPFARVQRAAASPIGTP